MNSIEDPQMSYECDREQYIASLLATQAELVAALRPFAQFACDDPTCECYNCTARSILAKVKP